MLIIEYVKEAAEKEGITMDELLERKGKMKLPPPVRALHVCLMRVVDLSLIAVLLEVSAIKGTLHLLF